MIVILLFWCFTLLFMFPFDRPFYTIRLVFSPVLFCFVLCRPDACLAECPLCSLYHRCKISLTVGGSYFIPAQPRFEDVELCTQRCDHVQSRCEYFCFPRGAMFLMFCSVHLLNSSHRSMFDLVIQENASISNADFSNCDVSADSAVVLGRSLKVTCLKCIGH